MFSDHVTIIVQAGNGGDGSAHLRREKYVPHGGPDGGDGGRGGSIVLRARHNINTLYHFMHAQRFLASDGGNGGGNRCHGKAGDDRILDVPVGTLIYDDAHDRLLADLVIDGQTVEVARGGRGGLGNTHFVTPTHQTPRIADKGAPGEQLTVRLELRLIADVGLVGLPNAGKSTLLSSVTAARPKIADYPFTTLVPNLGVVTLDEDNTFVIADIPGLIEGAHTGVGLGHEFLRHIERTLVLIHIVDASSGDVDEIMTAFHTINRELGLYRQDLINRPQVVAVNKMDISEARDVWPALEARLQRNGFLAFPISAATGEGTLTLLRQAWHLLSAERASERAEHGDPAMIPMVIEAERDPDVLHVIPIPSGFRVRSQRAERIILTTPMETDEGVARLQRLLRTAGITRALEQAGVKGGDKVWIGSMVLTWEA